MCIRDSNLYRHQENKCNSGDMAHRAEGLVSIQSDVFELTSTVRAAGTQAHSYATVAVGLFTQHGVTTNKVVAAAVL